MGAGQQFSVESRYPWRELIRGSADAGDCQTAQIAAISVRKSEIGAKMCVEKRCRARSGLQDVERR